MIKKHVKLLLALAGISGLIVFSTDLIAVDTFKGAHKENVSSTASTSLEITKTNTGQSNELHQLKRIVINDFFSQRVDYKFVSNQLKSRIEAGEFAPIWEQNFELYDVQVYKTSNLGDIQVAFIDVILKRNNKYQWLQLKTLWEQEILLDISYQNIDYISRINELNGHNEAVNFAENILTNLKNVDSSNFGWRLQDQNPFMNPLAKIKVNAVTALGIFEPITKNSDIEVLIKAEYEVNLEQIEQFRQVEALLYLKRYDGKWQVENIQVIEVEELS